MKATHEILELEKILQKLEELHSSFDYLRITLASPERIRSWAERILPDGEIVGEILKAETVNFRSHQPEIYGLFCEKIFGPIRNWKCKCGKYNGFVLDKVCDECHVEIIESRVRRYRMGYVDLTCPIVHLWYLKGTPNYLTILLSTFDDKLKASYVENITYFKEVRTSEKEKNILYEFLYRPKNELTPFFTSSLFSKKKKGIVIEGQIRRGGEIIKAALESIQLANEIEKARSTILFHSLGEQNSLTIPSKTIIRRIRILESFLATKTNPSWLVLTTLPVLPPNLRPLIELEGGRLVAADINEMYRLIITRNQRLFDFLSLYFAPELITIQGRKLLQESVDSLIDNARLPKERKVTLNNKALKSLTEILEGKQGRFRYSLLGKRVDYSGRSVIVVGPTLRLNQCGLPYEMAKELFQPFLINELLKTKIKAPSHNTKLAHIIIKKNKPFIWTLLVELTRKYSILLNRAPTLHRFGIQAFDSFLVLGQAIHLHPLVCTGFNADFDGDQMAVHLPLYEASQLEIRTMMRPCFNVLSPSNGEVILKPTQDMVIGCYYLTLMIHQNKHRIQKWFSTENEALRAFSLKKITIHTPVLIHSAISRWKCFVEDRKLFFPEKNSLFPEWKQELIIYKSFFVQNNFKKAYFITNIGIVIAQCEEKNHYFATDFFFETSPGRLLFNANVKNAMKE